MAAPAKHVSPWNGPWTGEIRTPPPWTHHAMQDAIASGEFRRRAFPPSAASEPQFARYARDVTAGKPLPAEVLR